MHGTNEQQALEGLPALQALEERRLPGHRAHPRKGAAAHGRPTQAHYPPVPRRLSAPGRARTRDLAVRGCLLYPAELPALGGPPGGRTLNLEVKSQLLCQLS